MPSIPYPVLCPISLFDDEEPGHDPAFKPEIYGTIDLDGLPSETKRVFNFTITFKNDCLAGYIHAKKAKISLVIEAKTSLVRHAIELAPGSAEFAKGQFTHDNVDLDKLGIALPAEATIYIASTEEIPDYVLPGAPSSMGLNDGVDLPKGAILGYSLVLPLLPRLEKASSIIEIRLKEDLAASASPLIQYTESDKIRVFLDPRSYGVFSNLKDNDATGPILTYALVMPALIQAVTVVMSDRGDLFDEAVASRLWFQSLEAAIGELREKGDVYNQSLPYDVAHLIMKDHLTLSSALINIPSTTQSHEE
jgi:hypothetical protein